MDAPAFLGVSMSNAALATRPGLILGPQPSAAVLLLEIAIRTAKDVPAPPEPPPPPPSIISDGLVLHFDIANPACYPGSGLAFTDLSSNGNHGTLTGPTNIADGAINFDGTTNLTTTTLISNPQSFTIGIWFRTSAALGRKLIGLESSQIGGSSSYDRHFYVDTAGQLRWGVWSPGTSTFLYGNVTDNQWRYAVVSFNNGAMLLSMNGQAIGNVTAVSQPFDGYWRIGGQSLGFWPSAASGFFVGSVAAVEIYNRPLMIAEIEQNFNINRGRFGL
ncbi:MAG: LamG domain-containing protein [Roseomonas sp.]|nr:LamG domain-containing protein [Roseomonas sp.]